jgi:hypothetical protein
MKRDGYALVWAPDHPRVHADGYIFEHIAVVEKALGHYLPATAKVHHHNGVKDNNRNDNLVALENDGEHSSLHQRRRVQLAGGDPWTQSICCRCHRPKDKSEFYVLKSGRLSGDCKECSRASTRERTRLEKERSA